MVKLYNEFKIKSQLRIFTALPDQRNHVQLCTATKAPCCDTASGAQPA